MREKKMEMTQRMRKYLTRHEDKMLKIIFSSLKVYMIARGEISSQTAQHFPSEISFSEKKKIKISLSTEFEENVAKRQLK